MTKIDQALKNLEQKLFLPHLNHLSPIEQGKLLNELENIDPQWILKAKNVLQNSYSQKPLYSSFSSYESTINPEWQKIGEKLLEDGKCALLVLAGGSGSRLGFHGPKGCFPITSVRKKSLFQYIAEKVFFASKRANHALEMAIMTSSTNHEDTIYFFQKHKYFGLSPSQVHFFCQKQWPLLSLEGSLFLEEKDHISFGPNGNGNALKELYKSPIFAHFQKQGIEYLNVIPIDNPLADPFDCAFIGFHHTKHTDVSIKATQRTHPQEKVGVIVEGGQVVEYGEVRLQNEENALAYIGLFCIRFSVIEDIQDISLPLHCAKKLVKHFDPLQETSTMTFAWKFEYFLFDIFPFTKSVSVLCYPRKKCFAPLKNFEGDDSIEVVQKQLQEADREAFKEVSGITLPEEVSFELSLEFYYPTSNLRNRWQNHHILKVPNNSYIEGS